MWKEEKEGGRKEGSRQGGMVDLIIAREVKVKIRRKKRGAGGVA